MQLGAILTSLAVGANAAAALDAIGDIVLYAKVLEAGSRFDEAPAEYVSAAVGRYTSQAADEDWLALMTVVEKSEAPGRAVLQCILQWALVQDCSDHTAGRHEDCSCRGGPGRAHDHP